jgi:hypothetical protein
VSPAAVQGYYCKQVKPSPANYLHGVVKITMDLLANYCKVENGDVRPLDI